MKRLLSICLLSLSLSAGAQSMREYLSETRWMIEGGNYPEALNRCVWFHEHALEYEKSMYGVRLSFALSDWKTLGEKYPPAMASLKAIRDAGTAKLLTDGGSADLFADVAAINRTLEVNHMTTTLFETLMVSHPDKAKSYWHYVSKLYLSGKNYEIASQFLAEPETEFEKIQQSFQMKKEHSASLGENKEFFLHYAKERFVEKSLQLIDYAIASDKLDAAKEIQKLAYETLPDPRLEKSRLQDKR